MVTGVAEGKASGGGRNVKVAPFVSGVLQSDSPDATVAAAVQAAAAAGVIWDQQFYLSVCRSFIYLPAPESARRHSATFLSHYLISLWAATATVERYIVTVVCTMKRWIGLNYELPSSGSSHVMCSRVSCASVHSAYSMKLTVCRMRGVR